MRLDIDKSRMWWISDNDDLYTAGNKMELTGINGISLSERHIYYDDENDADGKVIYNHKAMFYFSQNSLYVRLQKLITRRKNDNNKSRSKSKGND